MRVVVEEEEEEGKNIITRSLLFRKKKVQYTTYIPYPITHQKQKSIRTSSSMKHKSFLVNIKTRSAHASIAAPLRFITALHTVAHRIG